MEFLSVRDFRQNSAHVWKLLAEQNDLVVTSNGKPIAILSAASESNLEESLAAIRAARANIALTALQTTASIAGLDGLSEKEIQAEVKATRKARAARTKS